MNNNNNETNNIGTPFDDVFRTLLEKCDKLIIPVINEVFGTDYNMHEKVTLLSNVHYVPDKDGNSVKRITDSCILIRDKMYHIECESTAKSGMEIRMIEYDFHIALSHSIRKNGTYTLNFPESAVIFLRSNSNTPDNLTVNIIMPNGSKTHYQIPTLKVQQYSKEEIFDKKLLLFLPYYIMRFEKRLKYIDKNDDELKKLSNEYRYIYNMLCKLEKENVIDIKYLHNLISLITKLINVVARNSKKVKGEIISMGGEVLVLESEIIEAKGIAEGISQGITQGMAENIIDFLKDYGEVQPELSETIYAQKDTTILKRWVKLSAKVSSIGEFKQKMYE